MTGGPTQPAPCVVCQSVTVMSIYYGYILVSRLLDYWAYFDTLRIMPSNWDIFYCTHPDIDPRY